MKSFLPSLDKVRSYREKPVHVFTSAQFHAEKITTIEQLRKLEHDWNTLHRESSNTLPFTTYTWAYHWWRHFHEERLVVRDSLSILVVRNSVGKAIAIAPMMTTAYPAFGPLQLRFLQFLGADPQITEVRGPLLHPDFEGPALRCIVYALESSFHGWNWIRWTGVRADSKASEVLEQAYGKEASTNGVCEYVLPLASSWEEFRMSCKRNIRESLRKCYNSLARDGYEYTFNVAETPDEVKAMLEQFFLLHRKRSQEPRPVRHPDYFRNAQSRAFLRDVCKDLAKSCCVKVFTLSVGDKVVAARVGFILNNSLYLYYSGYDPEWGKYSVMTTTVAEAIKYAIAHGLRTVGLSTGKDVSKTRWGPNEVAYKRYLLTAPSTKAQLAYSAYSHLQQVRTQQMMQRLAGWLLRRSE